MLQLMIIYKRKLLVLFISNEKITGTKRKAKVGVGLIKKQKDYGIIKSKKSYAYIFFTF
jgi:hypothetical protein